MQIRLGSAGRSDPRGGGEWKLLYCMSPWVGRCFHSGMRVEPGGGAKMWLVNPVRIKNLRAQLDARGGRGRLPSAGLVGASIALSTCRRVSLYGFGNASDANATGTHGRRTLYTLLLPYLYILILTR